MLHQNWYHTKSDFNTPSVGDAWVCLNPYSNEIFENTVVLVFEKDFILKNTYGVTFCISKDTLKAEGANLSEFDFYPLTEEVRAKVELRKEVTKVYSSLRSRLDKLKILDLSHEQRKSLLFFLSGLEES